MISRREKLLIRPWQQRRYEYHRKKVETATPVIDDGPPKNRLHVEYKGKKHQKESERCDKIEKDNLKLLQRLRNVMSTSRIDNTWTKAQPNFLNRVNIYNNKKVHPKKQLSSVSDDETNEAKTRRQRCSACTPKKPPTTHTPEERVPWKPLKSTQTKRRSQSVPLNKKSAFLPVTANEKKTANPLKPFKSKVACKSADPKRKSLKSDQCIILSRGEMQLAVSCPSDTTIKYKRGNSERLLTEFKGCHCKAFCS